MTEMHTPEDLLEIERERWIQLRKLLGEIPASRTDEPSIDPDGWSVRDLVWHLACWNDVVRHQLDLMRQGAFDDRSEWDTDQNNARFLASGSTVRFTEALTELDRSRVDV